MPEYIDIHSHLNFPQFDADREDILAEMERQNIWTIVIGTGLQTSQEAIALAEKYPHVFATIGVHPTDIEEAFDADAYAKLLTPKVVGVGECGLDYFRTNEGGVKEKQKELFKQQIDFAVAHELPLMIHARPSVGTMDAYEDTLEILATYNKRPRGNFHFFAGDTVVAQRALELGFTLSFDGPITFARDYDEVIRTIPLSMCMAETDAPFAAPVPYRGKRNSPLYVPHIVESIASIRGEDLEIVKKAMVENAVRVFGLGQKTVA